MVHSPSELNSRKRFKVLVCGVPGIGKSTLALSAPGVVLVDIDGGWDRIDVRHRKAQAYIQAGDYEELLADMKSKEVTECETVAIDTGGALLNLMKAWAIKTNPVNGQKDGVTLSQRGYGAVGAEFTRFCALVYEQLGKHLIVCFHAKEDMDGEAKVYRLDVEGQTRSNIWKPMDLGGFMEAIRDKRVIGFSPTDRYFAKGTHGITGLVGLPDLNAGASNDFFVTLFAKINQNIADESVVRKQYDKLMAEITNLVEGVTTEKGANDAMAALGKLSYVFGAKAQAWHILTERAEKIGLKWNPMEKAFVGIPTDMTGTLKASIEERKGAKPKGEGQASLPGVA